MLLYLLMHGRYPYDAKDPQSLMIKILTEPIEYVNTKTKLSSLSVEFMNCVLERDVRNRCDTKKAKQHPWMMQNLINLKPDIAEAGSGNSKTNQVVLEYIYDVEAQTARAGRRSRGATDSSTAVSDA